MVPQTKISHHQFELSALVLLLSLLAVLSHPANILLNYPKVFLNAADITQRDGFEPLQTDSLRRHAACSIKRCVVSFVRINPTTAAF